MKIKTQELLKFSTLINQFKLVKRAIHKIDLTLENDAEHSFDMAITAMFIIDSLELWNKEEYWNLDTDKVIRLCLVHDLVEVYAGDCCALTSSKELKQEKKELEKLALDKIKLEFPYIVGELIEEYEDQQTLEARFTKAIDRLVPFLLEYQTEFHSCNSKGVSFEGLQPRIDLLKEFPDIFDYLEDLLPKTKEYLCL